MTHPANTSLFGDVWRPFLALPTSGNIRVHAILAPVNMTSAAFLGQPSGLLAASDAYGGITFSAIAMLYSRGFSRLVSAGHIFPWTLLALILAFAAPRRQAPVTPARPSSWWPRDTDRGIS